MDYAVLGSTLAGIGVQTAAEIRASKETARLASQEAQQARLAGDYNANLIRKEARGVLGQQRVITAAAGYDTDSGSPLDIMMESAKQAELDALAVRQQAENRARLAKYRGQVAKGMTLPTVATGLTRSGAYFSDWFNKYSRTTPKSKFSKTELDWIDEVNS